MNREDHLEEPHITPPRTYVLVYLVLLLLLGASVAAAFFNLGPFNLVLALAIATFKSALVVIYFMHAREYSSLVKFFILAGILWLVMLISLTLSDYLTRVDPFSV
jgi:cytochrome c oxidase subunit 4